MPFWIKALVVLAAALCLAAQVRNGDVDAEPVENAAAPSWRVENTISIAAFAIIAAGLGTWFVIVVRRRMEQCRAEEEKAASRLEAEMMAFLRPPPSPPAPPTSDSPAPPIPPGASGLSVAEAKPERPDAKALESIVDKLRAGGLFGAVEGALFLSDGQSEGKIIRLSDGRMALVLPRLEPPEFLARHLKRFDLCIVALGADQLYVISPLGAMIASRFSL